jgi:hypothetical protein
MPQASPLDRGGVRSNRPSPANYAEQTLGVADLAGLAFRVADTPRFADKTPIEPSVGNQVTNRKSKRVAASVATHLPLRLALALNPNHCVAVLAENNPVWDCGLRLVLRAGGGAQTANLDVSRH